MNSRQLPASYIYHGNPGYDISVLEQIYCFSIMLKEFLNFGIKTIGKIFKVGFFYMYCSWSRGSISMGMPFCLIGVWKCEGFSLVPCKWDREFGAPRYFLTFPELIHYLAFSRTDYNHGSQRESGSRVGSATSFLWVHGHPETSPLSSVNRDDSRACITGELNEVMLIPFMLIVFLLSFFIMTLMCVHFPGLFV